MQHWEWNILKNQYFLPVKWDRSVHTDFRCGWGAESGWAWLVRACADSPGPSNSARVAAMQRTGGPEVSEKHRLLVTKGQKGLYLKQKLPADSPWLLEGQQVTRTAVACWVRDLKKCCRFMKTTALGAVTPSPVQLPLCADRCARHWDCVANRKAISPSLLSGRGWSVVGTACCPRQAVTSRLAFPLTKIYTTPSVLMKRLPGCSLLGLWD